MAAVALLPQSVAFFDARHGLLATAAARCGYLAGCAAAVEATADGGRTWTVRLQLRGPVTLSAERGTQTALAETRSAAFRTDDGGRTWRRVAKAAASTPAPCRGRFGFGGAVALTPSSVGWLVCYGQGGVGGQPKQLYASRDGGRTWTLREPERRMPWFGYVLGLQMLADGHGWLLLSRGGLVITADGGRTWRTASVTPPDEASPISASLLDDRTGFALLWDCHPRLVATSDGGRSWRVVRRFPNPVCG